MDMVRLHRRSPHFTIVGARRQTECGASVVTASPNSTIDSLNNSRKFSRGIWEGREAATTPPPNAIDEGRIWRRVRVEVARLAQARQIRPRKWGTGLDRY
jgi:hypothetical protein